MSSVLRKCTIFCLLLPALSGGGASGATVDPTSLKLSAALNFMPPVDNTNVNSPAPIKKGTTVPLVCSWKAAFVKPVVFSAPINLTIVIAETTTGVVHLKQATGFVKPGNYTFPGQAAQGDVVVTWKPEGLGIHDVSCMVSTTNAEWWGQGALPIVKAFRKVQVEPDTFKVCPFAYPAQVAKSPKSDQVIPAGIVAPAEVILVFNYSQASGNQFICHYRSKNGDIADVAVTVPCTGAKLLPPVPGQFLKQDRYACN